MSTRRVPTLPTKSVNVNEIQLWSFLAEDLFHISRYLWDMSQTELNSQCQGGYNIWIRRQWI
jgi:hypothetical protein